MVTEDRAPRLSIDAQLAARFSRRKMLKLAALVGASGALTSILAACGSSSSSPTTSGSGASSGSTATSSSGAGASGSPGTTSSSTSTGNANIKLASDQTLRYINTEPTHMDPGLTTSLRDLQIIDNVWEGLLYFDYTGSPVPLGAEKWDISEDGTVYTFHLRDGVKWTDGTAITAHDYEWTWKRNEDPNTASQYAQALYNIKGAEDYNTGKGSADAMGVKALDDKTLQVTLTGPAGYFLQIAGTWTAYPLPKQSIEKNGAKWTDPPNAISNGPFKLTTWNHDQQIVLERNDDYWGPKPTLQKINVTIVTDLPTSSLKGYENNELDYAIGPWPADMDRIQKDSTLGKQLHLFPDSNTEMVVCDAGNTKSPVSKLEFRQALYLGIDRAKIAQEIFKIYSPAYTMLPDDIKGHNPNAKIQGTVDDAKNLLSKAGFPGGKGVNLTLPYSHTTNSDLLAQALAQMWEQNLGIKITLNPMESKAYTAYRQTLKTNHFDIVLGGWYSDYLDAYDWMSFLFASDTDFWYSHWKNDQYDSLVHQAAILSDQQKRQQFYSQAEQILVTQAVFIPIYHSATPYLIKPWVIGYSHNGTGFDLFKDAKIAQH